MNIKAQFSVNGQPVQLDVETGRVNMSQRGRLDLLRLRTDKRGNVWQQQILNGDRINTTALLEASAPTLTALLDAVEQDEIRLRGPVRPESNVRVVHRRDAQANEDYHYTVSV